MARFKRLRGTVKGFSQPTFWSGDALRWESLSAVPMKPNEERAPTDYLTYAQSAYKDNGVVFAVAAVRQLIFSEARFQWQRIEAGRPGDLFGTAALSLLERPWPGGTTGDLLSRMEQDVATAGNFYATLVDDQGRTGKAAQGGPGARIVRMRPDWVTILIGSRSGNPYALDARVIAYAYSPPAQQQGLVGPELAERVLLLPGEVAHYCPYPDPEARFRGMSWVTPVVREVLADKAATKHKLKFFEHGAASATMVSLDKDVSPEAFAEFVAKFKAQHEGVDNAYKTIFLGGGADVTVTGTTLQQLEFKATQGAGETRIAAAGGISPIVVGLSEGLQGSSLNVGNYGAARRRVADGTLRPLWRTAAACLENLVGPPPGVSARLWYDDRDIPFLREDTDAASKTAQQRAATIRTYIEAGFEPDAAVEAVVKDNPALLAGKHTGLTSVQLSPPTEGADEDTTPPPATAPPATEQEQS